MSEIFFWSWKPLIWFSKDIVHVIEELGSSKIRLCCVTFHFLVNANKNINQRALQNKFGKLVVENLPGRAKLVVENLPGRAADYISVKG